VVSALLNGRYYSLDKQHSIGASPATRARVLAAARRLRYEPDDAAALARIYPERGDYCFLLSGMVDDGMANPYFSRIFKGAMECLAKRNPSAHLIFSHFSPQADFVSAPDLLPAPVANGTVTRGLLAGRPNYSLLTALQQRGLPVVYLSRHVPLPGLVSVVPDYAEGSRLAIRHLHRLGHRRIAIACEHYHSPDDYNTRLLVQGCSEEMKHLGLRFDPSDIIQRPSVGPSDGDDFFVREILRRSPRPTAVYCFDDWVASQVVRFAPSAGVRIPQDLSVVGCIDGSTATSVVPSLTSVHYPSEEMGARGVLEADRLLSVNPTAEPKEIVLPVHLVERSSTGRHD
jgi:LacI family transcriptional regulator